MDYFTIQLRRGIEAERIGTVFASGEPVWITDTQRLYIGDGTTSGGILTNVLPVGILVAGASIEQLVRGTLPAGKMLVTNPTGNGIGTRDIPVIVDNPSEFNYTTSALTLAAGASVIVTQSLDTSRLYGKYVAITGLASGQKVRVSFYGNTTNTGVVDLQDLQYQSEFTDLLPEDTRQLWFYRDRRSNKILRTVLVNLSTESVTVQLHVVGEPL